MEGWVEIEIKHPIKGYTGKVFKSCGDCIHLKRDLHKSGKNPVYFDWCSIIEEKDSQGFKLHTNLLRNVYNYVEPPGIDGEECPFDKQVKRDLQIKKIIE